MASPGPPCPFLDLLPALVNTMSGDAGPRAGEATPEPFATPADRGARPVGGKVDWPMYHGDAHAVRCTASARTWSCAFAKFCAPRLVKRWSVLRICLRDNATVGVSACDPQSTDHGGRLGGAGETQRRQRSGACDRDGPRRVVGGFDPVCWVAASQEDGLISAFYELPDMCQLLGPFAVAGFGSVVLSFMVGLVSAVS